MGSIETVEVFIAKNKGILIALGVILLLGGVGYSVFRIAKEKEKSGQADKIYAFETTVFKDYKDEKISPEEFLSKLRKMREEFEGSQAFYSFLLLFADELVKQNQLDHAKEVLLWGKEGIRHAGLRHLFLIRLSSVYEDLGGFREAVDILLEATNAKRPSLVGKLYLDLGRLYKKLGELDKAKAGFQYVIDNSEESEFLKLARIYMRELEVK